MGFTVQVHIAGRRSITIEVTNITIDTLRLKAMIATSTDAKDAGIFASAWGLFCKKGGPVLRDFDPIAAEPHQSVVELWAENVVAAVAAGKHASKRARCIVILLMMWGFLSHAIS